MPHIDVNLFPGRTEEQKQKLADKIVEDAMEILGAPREALSVAMHEVAPENWNQDIADKVDEKSIVTGKMYRTK
ncbi:MAG: 4-oxalocrotonate tautomerase family protein [Eubacteriales bacterium]|uniref:4-oxalocrotonate tautomerase family protein n=1 Tax=Baileyella intestinalis TaxID=2606709 RepID=A0A6A8M5M0_9FIRM|nr:4-oxalocrotonate tautomerase family protein [Baileyella intestinalis]MDD5875528.1 4-oxalocrotonate tautomerase family protein [Baileyella intestinalis]MDY2994354.1 4-oxalocrotonate tautomerase family protein [Baileyella intestinalis]MST68625.1 4-oxalocrotonate tautomerase family protein [Baileyella intestinalis]